MPELLVNILGWLGAVLYLAAYILVSTRRLSGDSFTYQGLNLLGGVCLVVNAFHFGAYPSVGINIAWIFIAISILFSTWRKRHSP